MTAFDSNHPDQDTFDDFAVSDEDEEDCDDIDLEKVESGMMDGSDPPFEEE